jgi:hypothetical protein
MQRYERVSEKRRIKKIDGQELKKLLEVGGDLVVVEAGRRNTIVRAIFPQAPLIARLTRHVPAL